MSVPETRDISAKRSDMSIFPGSTVLGKKGAKALLEPNHKQMGRDEESHMHIRVVTAREVLNTATKEVLLSLEKKLQ